MPVTIGQAKVRYSSANNARDVALGARRRVPQQGAAAPALHSARASPVVHLEAVVCATVDNLRVVVSPLSLTPSRRQKFHTTP